MIVKLEGEVNEGLVDKLIEAVNTCNPEDKLHVYLSTNGGSESDMNAIINIIDESDVIEVVFCFSTVFSAGFVIAMSCLKPVEFLDGCLGMMHKGSFYGGLWTDELKVHKNVKDVMKLHSKNAKALTEKMIELHIFTKKEEEKIRKNKDVYFNTERLREMREIVWAPIQEEINKAVEEWANSIRDNEEVEKEETTIKLTDTTDTTTAITKKEEVKTSKKTN